MTSYQRLINSELRIANSSHTPHPFFTHYAPLSYQLPTTNYPLPTTVLVNV
ncbi:hypothetical protein IQ272_26975 [Chroococcidiopsidales cyanobacterium LEGE 13417]|uniref:hypothetical protein n=1 Tax=Chroococcidiopsis sp. CCALA 051 TaxID=869949 RepID=UPI0013049B9F|nr:hypothetical protein [Chroococcidiopsis sp. CCALA 051]MBE9019709.1 hypothetical protein [Chroococcidiopsidales cyanobacterium LEGE 13417]